MSLKRECDRCHHITSVDSIDGRKFQVVQIHRGATASTNGGTSTIFKPYDLCKNCVASLERWLDRAPVEAATS